MRDTFTLKFFLKDIVKKGVKEQIIARITVDRKKTEIATKLFVAPSDWIDGAQRSKKDKIVNEELLTIENDITRIKNQLRFENKPISSKIIRDIYVGKGSTDSLLLHYFQNEIEKRAKNPKEFSTDSTNSYKLTKKYIGDYIYKTQGVKDILLKQVDYKFIGGLDEYMTSLDSGKGGTLERNTINKHHSRFRTILIKALKENSIAKNPYTDFTLKNTKSSRTYLTSEELDKITQHGLGNNESLIKTRDIFIFSVYTGLRFADASRLTAAQIIRDKNGKYFIQKNQSKTEEPVFIPLLKPALEIIKKYDNEDRKITGYILPILSNQKLNVYLKTIAELAGIDKEISHHVARHTCATTILLNNDIPLEIVSKWLGHNSLKTTQIYGRITNKRLADIGGKLDENL